MQSGGDADPSECDRPARIDAIGVSLVRLCCERPGRSLRLPLESHAGLLTACRADFHAAAMGSIVVAALRQADSVNSEALVEPTVGEFGSELAPE